MITRTSNNEPDRIDWRMDSPGPRWSEIWLVSLERIMRNPFKMDRLTHRLNLEMRLNASVNLLVSLSTCGADKFDAPKLLSNKAKKRFNTCHQNTIKVCSHSNVNREDCNSLVDENVNRTYDQIANDDRGQKERDASGITDQHAVPHGLDPFTAQDSEYNHERVHEIGEIPSRQLLVGESVDIVCRTRTGIF